MPFTIPANNRTDATISVDTQLTTTSGQYLPTFYYRNLTVNSGVTLTTSNPCKGLILVVTGTLTLNGTISMTARGFGSATLPSPDAVNLYTLSHVRRIGLYEPFEITDSPSNAIFPISTQTSPITPAGSNGSSGQMTLSCGGGGGSYGTTGYQVCPGGLGYVFSGGSGACGIYGAASGDSRFTTIQPENYGLTGGYAIYNVPWLGGAGNPGGGGLISPWGGLPSLGETGTGGLLIVVANIIQGTGKFVSKGSNGGASSVAGTYSGGGGSGGGIVFVRCVTNNSFDYGTGINTTGGLANTDGTWDAKNGGEGYKSFEVFI